jgi:hypothetical protein
LAHFIVRRQEEVSPIRLQELLMRHLSRIVATPFGVNILGLLELFALIGSLAGTIALANYIPQSLRWLLLGCLAGPVVAIVVFDLWWRHRQPETTRWGRLFSPFAGGCFFFLPIWLLLPCFIVGCVVAVILRTR